MLFRRNHLLQRSKEY